MGSPSKTTDAGNYRDRFAVGNCLNIFSGNCVVSPPRKNKEKQCRITGQRVEVEGKARERGRGEPRKSRKRRRNGEEQRNDWGGGGGGVKRQESLQIVGHPLQKGVLFVPVFRHSEQIRPPSLLSSCPSPVSSRSFVKIMKAGILPPIVSRLDDAQRRLFLMKPK